MTDKQKPEQTRQLVQKAVESGKGVVRLAPSWVPRMGSIPGRRLRLHPDDLYALGVQRGGITERCLASTTRPKNGPSTPPDQALSHIVHGDHKSTLLDPRNLMGQPLIRTQPSDQ